MRIRAVFALFAAASTAALAQSEAPKAPAAALPAAPSAATATAPAAPAAAPAPAAPAPMKDGQAVVTSWVLGSKICALRHAVSLALASAEGRNGSPAPSEECQKKCRAGGERFLVSDKFTSTSGEAWPSWKIDNPEKLSADCNKHVQATGNIVGQDAALSSMRLFRVTAVEPYTEPQKPPLKTVANNEQGQRPLSDKFLPHARRYQELLQKWELSGGSIDVEAEAKLKEALQSNEETDADDSTAKILLAYRVTLSRRAAQQLFDGGKLTPEHAETWGALLKACRDEIDLSMTGGIALDRSKCVDALKP
ncbi:MAG: hypothetical protein HY078_16425 [Elusimicrobia bacterium]|nr:hypothetical protein [Elusimicrobiota bacterium]